MNIETYYSKTNLYTFFYLLILFDFLQHSCSVAKTFNASLLTQAEGMVRDAQTSLKPSQTSLEPLSNLSQTLSSIF